MSNQNENLLLREQKQLAIYEEFCWNCGEELYRGDPPQDGYCINPHSSQCEIHFVEDYEEEE